MKVKYITLLNISKRNLTYNTYIHVFYVYLSCLKAIRCDMSLHHSRTLD